MAYADEIARLQRRRMLAQALAQQGAQPQGQQAGRIYVAPTPLSTLGSLASIAGGALLDRKLEKQEKSATETERKRLSDALRGLMGPDNSAPPNGVEGAQGPVTPPDPKREAAMAVLQGLPLDQIQGVVGQQAIANLFPKPKELKQVDLGNEIGWADETGNIVRKTPKGATPQGDTDTQRNYAAAVEQGFKGSIFDYQRALAEARALGAPVNLQSTNRPTAGGGEQPGAWNPRTGTFTPQGPEVPKKPSEGDKKNAVLFDSILNAEKQIEELELSPDVTDTSSLRDQVLGVTPVTKTLQSEDFRKYESAALRWSANLLYLKSGATATPEEVQSTRKQFFPQPGDGPEVKAQKAIARQQELESVRRNMAPTSSGPAPSDGWSIKPVN